MTIRKKWPSEEPFHKSEPRVQYHHKYFNNFESYSFLLENELFHVHLSSIREPDKLVFFQVNEEHIFNALYVNTLTLG